MRRRFSVEWSLIAVLLPLFMLWASERPGLGTMDREMYDVLQRFDRAAGPSPDVVIIGIDARSIAALGAWPLPRSVHAQLLERLVPHPPRGVLFNVFFDTAGAPAGDAQLAAVMARLPVYLPMRWVGTAHAPAVPAGSMSRFAEPVGLLARAAHGLGHANVMVDGDERVRSIYRYEGTRARLVPYVGLLAATGARDAMPSHVDLEPRDGWMRRERFGFRLAWPPGSYRTVSYVDVLSGVVPAATLAGKIVLIGATSDSGLGDQLAVTGLGVRNAALPGVEVHANAIDVLMRCEVIDFPGAVVLWLWIALPIWVAMGLLRLSAPRAVGGLILLVGATLVIGGGALQGARIALPIVTPLAGIGIAYALWSWRRIAGAVRFFRSRIDALNAVPATAFERAPAAVPARIDVVEQGIDTLDHAIGRMMSFQAMLRDALALMPVAVLICRSDGAIGQSNAAARTLLAPDHAGDTLAGCVLFELLAQMERTELVEPQPCDEGATPPWREASQGEYTTAQGAIFRAQWCAWAGPDRSRPSRTWCSWCCASSRSNANWRTSAQPCSPSSRTTCVRRRHRS